MQIIVDADACPVLIRKIVFNAAKRFLVQVTLVANHRVPTPSMDLIKLNQVGQGFDVADQAIIKMAKENDLVITNDIELASKVIYLGCNALSTRGEIFLKETIKTRIMFRDIQQQMRDQGINTTSTKPLSQKDRQNFANNFNKIIQKTCSK